MTSAEKKAWLPFAEKVGALPQVDPRVTALVREADALLARFKKTKRIVHDVGETRKEKRAAKREKHREETAVIWAAVMKRAGGQCEICGRWATSYNPLHMHHKIGGSGKRRQQQSVATCIAICFFCHRKEHGLK